VIEDAFQPIILGMTDGTVSRITLGFVIQCGIKIYLMTQNTTLRCGCEISLVAL
jgi:hypothetical protein